MYDDNGVHSETANHTSHEREIQVQHGSTRVSHPDYVPTRPVRVRIVLISGMRCIGDIHVKYPDGRVSDVLNDERTFTPLTNVVLEGDSTVYDFLTINKSQISVIFEIRHE